MLDIKEWSKGDSMLFEAVHLALAQGKVLGKIEANVEVENWEQEWLIERVNETLTEFDIKPVETFAEALSYGLTIMPLKNQGMAQIEQFGRMCGSMGIV